MRFKSDEGAVGPTDVLGRTAERLLTRRCFLYRAGTTERGTSGEDDPDRDIQHPGFRGREGGKQHVMQVLADIVQRFNIVAMQEIRSDRGEYLFAISSAGSMPNIIGTTSS